jgi:hypothetical protein
MNYRQAPAPAPAPAPAGMGALLISMSEYGTQSGSIATVCAIKKEGGQGEGGK